MEETLRTNASRPLFSGTTVGIRVHCYVRLDSLSLQEDAPEILPHVYTSSSMVQGNLLSHLGTKYVLPIGTTREFHDV